MWNATLYILGALSLHFTDLHSSNGFYNTFLPLIDLIFLIFLLWQLIEFFSLNNFSDGGKYRFFDLLADIYDLHYDIKDSGILPALFNLVVALIETACLILAAIYYYGMAVDLIGL